MENSFYSDNEVNESPRGVGIASLVLGALSIINAPGLIGGILGIIGIVLSRIARSRGMNGSIEVPGLICSIIGLVLSVLLTVLYVALGVVLYKYFDFNAFIDAI